jgi:hypothetical protein
MIDGALVLPHVSVGMISHIVKAAFPLFWGVRRA